MIDARAKPPAPEPMEEAIAIAKQSVDAITVPETLHPLVAKTFTVARKATLDLNGAIKDLGPEVSGYAPIRTRLSASVRF